MNYIDKASELIANYLQNTVGFPAVETDNAVYFPVGEEKIAYLLNELNKAEKSIFLEYFIVEEGLVWSSILNLLKKKATEGVDIRLICDGIGCMLSLPLGFVKDMAKIGIKVRIFNPLYKFWKLNTRNHRKTAIIDGKVAFCGGLNLSDRYANIEEVYGHWKDSAVMVDGDIAEHMNRLFLAMWGDTQSTMYNLQSTMHNAQSTIDDGQCTIATCLHDNPKDEVPVSEHTLINFISRAEEYVYIMTPYFMCKGDILSVMYTAARSGVDVRIITPYIADKKPVKLATESYYRSMLENKVRVFEYIPGFIHSKNLISDGKRAMVGTVNLDYRSLYQHYECGVCFFGGKIIDDINKDFQETFGQCKEITLSDLENVSFLKKAAQRICRFFAPIF